FFGSSSESKPMMDELARHAEAAGAEPITWDQPEVLGLAEYTLDSLWRIAAQVDAAVLVFGADDKTWYRGEVKDTARDNVLIEYGLFSGILGSGRVAFACAGNVHVPSDLRGLNYLDASPSRRQEAKRKLKLWLDSVASTAYPIGESEDGFQVKEVFEQLYMGVIREHPTATFLCTSLPYRQYFWKKGKTFKAIQEFLCQGGRMQRVFFLKKPELLQDSEVQEILSEQKEMDVDVLVTDRLPEEDQKLFLVEQQGRIAWEVETRATLRIDSVYVTEHKKTIDEYRRRYDRIVESATRI
ncbi:MAG: nucleotide-binding protein, partial [Cyanobacteria bacterium J06648_11]